MSLIYGYSNGINIWALYCIGIILMSCHMGIEFKTHKNSNINFGTNVPKKSNRKKI